MAGGIDGDDPAPLRQMGGDGAEPLRGSRQIGDEQQRPCAVAAPLSDHERCAVHLDEAARARLLRRRRCRRQPGGAGASKSPIAVNRSASVSRWICALSGSE